MGKVSCSRKQQGPLMGVEPTTDTLSVRWASLLYFYIILLKNKKELQTGLHLSLLYMCLFTLKVSNLQAKVLLNNTQNTIHDVLEAQTATKYSKQMELYEMNA